MPASTRRSFFTQATALLPLSRAAFAKEPLTHNNLGVQLYTVRNVIEKDPAATLKAIQDIGYAEVEATYGNLDKIWPALKETSLKPVSVHVDTDIFMQGGSTSTLHKDVGVHMHADRLQTRFLESGPNLIKISVGRFHFGVADVLYRFQSSGRIFLNDIAHRVELNAQIIVCEWFFCERCAAQWQQRCCLSAETTSGGCWHALYTTGPAQGGAPPIHLSKMPAGRSVVPAITWKRPTRQSLAARSASSARSRSPKI